MRPGRPEPDPLKRGNLAGSEDPYLGNVWILSGVGDEDAGMREISPVGCGYQKKKAVMD